MQLRGLADALLYIDWTCECGGSASVFFSLLHDAGSLVLLFVLCLATRIGCYFLYNVFATGVRVRQGRGWEGRADIHYTQMCGCVVIMSSAIGFADRAMYNIAQTVPNSYCLPFLYAHGVFVTRTAFVALELEHEKVVSGGRRSGPVSCPLVLLVPGSNY